jgi:membrane-bound lytic murein transglycosylase F
MIAVIPRTATRLLPAITVVVTAMLSGCAQQEDSLDRIRSRGELEVATRYSPTTFYTDRNGPTGFEYALAGLLADELQVELKMAPAFTLEDIFRSLTRGDADLAAAGLTLTAQRRRRFPATIPYYRFRPQVVYLAGTYRPRRVADLLDMSAVVLADSSLVELLQDLQQNDYPALRWQEVASADTMDLLERVNGGEAQLAIVHSNEFTVQQSLYPRLKVAFDLGPEQGLAWYLAPGRDNARLQALIDDFIQRTRDSGTLERLREQYFGHSDGISRISSHTFNRKMRTALPRYLALIKQVAQEYQIDWHLLAAMAYQESHWNPAAESPTGVRGMMMLTLPTAAELGVKNRLDPADSLRGGARYLKNIKRRLPKRIQDPDRTWLALAAYNIGMGHLEDARVITQRQGGNPDRWQDVAERLPLLQQSKHYEATRHGYARGVEAATYVQNIRHYHSILQWQDISGQQPRAPLRVGDYLPEPIRGRGLPAL